MGTVHTILFSRPGEDTHALLKIGVRSGFEDQDPLELLINALTDWVIETREGRDVWDANYEDFNVGDLMNLGLSNLRDFHRFLDRHHLFLVDSVDLGVRREPYDRCLIDRLEFDRRVSARS